MKITCVEAIHIGVPFEHGGSDIDHGPTPWTTMDSVFVRVETEDGLTGWGEAFGLHSCALAKQAIAGFVGPACIGRDSSDVAALMDDLHRRFHNFGRNGSVTFALSGIDIALWDLAGQRAGRPLHVLFGGGGGVDRVPAYASLMRYREPDLVARTAARAVAEGYREVKLHERGVAETEAAREAVGPETALSLDVNCAWVADEAVAMARRLRGCGLKWIEEPVWPPEDLAGLARVAREGGVPVAAGENIGSVHEFARLAEFGGVAYVQPCIAKIGGVTAMLRIFADAKARGVAVAPHSPYFGPGLIATIHLSAALLDGASVERFYVALEASPLGAAVEAPGGFMHVPQGPGLGVAVDEDVLARYRVG